MTSLPTRPRARRWACHCLTNFPCVCVCLFLYSCICFSGSLSLTLSFSLQLRTARQLFLACLALPLYIHLFLFLFISLSVSLSLSLSLPLSLSLSIAPLRFLLPSPIPGAFWVEYSPRVFAWEKLQTLRSWSVVTDAPFMVGHSNWDQWPSVFLRAGLPLLLRCLSQQ